MYITGEAGLNYRMVGWAGLVTQSCMTCIIHSRFVDFALREMHVGCVAVLHSPVANVSMRMRCGCVCVCVRMYVYVCV